MNIVATIERYDTCSRWWRKRSAKNIRAGVPIFCCDDMETAWGEFIHFGEGGIINLDGSVNIYRVMGYPEGAVVDRMPIQYCPFCGKIIEVELREAN